jgi:hypothetical protein
MQALREANERRFAYSKIKATIAALPAENGRATVANHLRLPNDTVAGMRLDYLLLAIHRMGRAVMVRVLAGAAAELGGPVRENRRVGELTDRQRNALADELTRQAAR